jgi:hypothetical protein
MRTIICTLMMALTAAAAAEPNAVLYQLQERCGKRAEEVFRQDQDWGKDPTATFESHYDAWLNKCFILERSTKSGMLRLKLFDANESKNYGEYVYDYKQKQILECHVRMAARPATTLDGEQKCISETEWKIMVELYMED